MAVLVEALSVIVRRDAIDARFSGGWEGFLETIPNQTFCADEQLARVGFMSPPDVERYVRFLEANGLKFARSGETCDFSVVDQLTGPTLPTPWLEYGRVTWQDGQNPVSACWLFEGTRLGYGLHMSGREMTIAVPNGWDYETSLSINGRFTPTEQMKDRLEFLRGEDNMDVYLDRDTGKEVYVGRNRG